MIVVNIHEVKAKLSEYVEAVTQGEVVVICKRNRPVAEMRALEQKRIAPRPIGGGRHTFVVPDAFFEPMPDDFLDAFDAGSVYPDTRPSPSRVAERPAGYGSRARRKKR